MLLCEILHGHQLAVKRAAPRAGKSTMGALQFNSTAGFLKYRWSEVKCHPYNETQIVGG